MRVLVLFLLLVSASIDAQHILIDEVTITGNKKTRDRVILRELPFRQDSKIDTTENSITDLIAFSEKRLLGLGLFNKVTVDFVPISGDHYKVDIEVNENWYIYPGVIFELADRNFNLWWYELDRDLSRVNYGLRLDYANVTGNRDKLTLLGHLGYTRKLELKYSLPFLDKAGNWNLSFNAFYADAREIAYATENNKTLFGRNNEDIMLTRFRLGGHIGYRKDLFASHTFRLEYHDNNISEYAATELNPSYFLDGKTQNQFFFFNYTYTFDSREFKIFPEAGHYLHLNLKKEGFYIFNDYDNLSLALEYRKYYNIDAKWIWNYSVKAKANLIRNKVAFANNTALGWGNDVVRGYEIYAIDGSDFAYIKTDAHYKFLDRSYNWSKYIPLRQFNKINVKMYLSFGVDAGVANERDYIETNAFNNRLLYGYGPTFSLMLYNTYLFEIDYSWNHIGEGGIYVNSRNSF